MQLCFLAPHNRVPSNIEPCSSGRCPIAIFTAPNVRDLLSGQVNWEEDGRSANQRQIYFGLL